MSEERGTTAAERAPERVFAEPWQAQAFALVVKLHEGGHFTWPEWAERLSRAIAEAQAAGDPDSGETYCRHWLAALESLVAEKGLVSDAELAARSREWKAAYEATPHGQPIELSAGKSGRRR